ncbi:MAG: FAD:protein FMN transferase [Gammaproteobacteria bacterium]|nr:FAD:protein FMN transferase [Gammaproteobacteria bacterium]MBT8109101.1 FAD:protein FMN transferase [Gammaproteobacteria bacterium]NND46537.1 FAD:protein FMN transferase [Woeseiaceae bacterium]NNL43804.1 FAD:protein FMN transferase [Woeseiaceae bacterium]
MIGIRHVVVLSAALFFAACGDSRLPEFELSGSTMGTTFTVTLVAPGDDIDRERLKTEIAATLAGVDELTSTWRADSELAVFNANAATDWIMVSAELCNAIDNALEISRLSEGAFDITIGPLVNLWGFGPDGEIREPPDDALIEETMAYIGYEGLQTRCGQPAMRKRHGAMYVDLSGWAKGYAVDKVAELLDEYGLSDYLVEIGGELSVRGHNAEGRKWAIAVEAPSTTSRRPHSVLRITDTSVATSGDYRNYFDHGGQRYSHTIDARTGRPVAHDLAAVTVVSKSAARADAMATALLVLGPESGLALAEKLGIASYFLVRDNTGIEELTTSSFELLRHR